ncbi:MAG: MATE family efflux transporter [Muribaculaceae bacterium]|nr:MATE family efflux transporter [Muribaculaceae bacterium]
MRSEKSSENVSLNRKIIRLTVPTVLSNISVPLLGLCDSAVAGHMDGEQYLAGIAIGSVMMTTMYWLFSFLRAGTSGLTATYFGASDQKGMGDSLRRSLTLAILVGLMLMSVQTPMLSLLHMLLGPSAEVSYLSGRYFTICVLGAVPMMVLTALSGWFIGMQSTAVAMGVNIGMSVINVMATLILVYGAKMGFEGIAYGTLAAQWLILIPAVWLAVRLCKKHGIKRTADFRWISDKKAWGMMLNVNSNLFFRSACLIALSMMLFGYSARLGDVEVSSNAVINQMFLFFSYFMDGFAFTGEALVGRYKGASDLFMLRKVIKYLLGWTVGIALLFVVAYTGLLPVIVKLLSDSSAVASSVEGCRLWVSLLPLAGVAAFIFDGFYIGLTRTFPMLISTLCGVALFAVLLHYIDHTQWMLWMAFTCYLALRSTILMSLFPQTLKILQIRDSKL